MSLDPVESAPQDPVGLAADVTALRADVTTLAEDVKDIAWGTTQELDALRASTKALHEALAEDAPDGPGKTKKAPAPRPWGSTATVEDWRTLAEWVDWFSSTYDTISTRRIAPCWPTHGGVVHELAALRSAWLDAATTPEPAGALAHWHDRVLWPLLMRLGQYRISLCTEGHKDVRPPSLTDQDVLEQVLQDVRVAADQGDDGPPADTSTGEVL